MLRAFAGFVVVALVAVLAGTVTAEDKKMPTPLAFKMKGIDGKPVDLASFKGKVVMVVNVASQCGLTPQYKELQATYEKYKGDGFVIVGVPANEFGKQEPGTDGEIAKFCESKYSVTFPLLSKVVVKGDGMCELYQVLTGKESPFPGDIGWNFEKFLIGKDGQIVARFAPRVAPSDAKIVKAIEAELKK